MPSSSRHSSSRRERRGIRHHWRKNRQTYVLVFGFLGAAIAMALFYVLTRKPEATEEQLKASRAGQTEVERTLERYAAAEVTPFPGEFTLQNLVDRIFLAYGGRSACLALSSLRREGSVLVDDGPTLGLTSFWKAPELARYTLDFQQFSLKRAYNGHVVSETRISRGRILESHEIVGDERERFIRNARISQPVVFSLQQLDNLTLLDDATVEGRDCYVIALQTRSYRETLFFDKSSFLCLQREREDSDLSGEPKQITIVFSDFRIVDDLIYNFKQSLYGDGKFINDIITDRVDANAGLLSDAFDPPPEMKKP